MKSPQHKNNQNLFGETCQNDVIYMAVISHIWATFETQYKFTIYNIPR